MAARAQLRRRWGATVALALLVGLTGGVVLAAVAGASRTDSAMKRFVAFSRPEDAFVSVNGPQLPGVSSLGGPPPDLTPAQLQPFVDRTLAERKELVHLPQVAEAGRAPYMLLSPDKDGKDFGAINAFAAADGHAFRTLDRPKVLHGRLARLDRVDEATVDDITARLRHLHVGSQVILWSYQSATNAGAAASGFGNFSPPDGPAYTFRVVGIVRSPSDVNTLPTSIIGDALYQGQGMMLLTPAFLQKFTADQGPQPGLPGIESLPGIEGFRIRFRPGADVSAFQRQVATLDVPAEEVHIGGSDIQNAADKAQKAIHLEAVALLLFAGLAALAGLLVVGQALGRQVVSDAEDNRTLAALGLGPNQLVLVSLARAGIIGLGGALISVVVAVALSPLTPVGIARRAEIHPGVSFNVAVLVLGFVAVALVTIARASIPAWRTAGTLARDAAEEANVRPGRLISAVAGSRLGPAATAGVGMSFERGGGLASRTALLGTLVAVAGVVAAVTFGVSLNHLVDSPRQQGWNWDVVVGNPNTADPLSGDPAAVTLHDQMVGMLEANPRVGGFAGFGLADGTTVNGRAVDLAGLQAIRGSLSNTIVEGRAPVADDEIVLGRDPLDEIHAHVGQTVTVRARGQSVPMRIVGVSLQPTAGDLSPRLSQGGAVTVAGMNRLFPPTPADFNGAKIEVPQIPILQFAVRFRPGANKTAATQSLVHDFGREVLQPYPGGEVGNLAKVDSLPYVLAAVLVVLAVAALALTLLNSVRRHRRDLAVLKTLGFVRPQVSATVAWQATILAVGALIIGVPAGVALGRWTWRLVANNAGSVSPAVVPLAAVLLVVPATLVVANLLAGGPAWAAGRVQPARVLKAE
jgi:putative ABC transport system permease protein